MPMRNRNGARDYRECQNAPYWYLWATETLLIDRVVAKKLLPAIADALVKAGCELRGDAEAVPFFPMKEATSEDWDTEYLDAILSVKL